MSLNQSRKCIIDQMQKPAGNIESYVMRLRVISIKCFFTTRLEQEMKLQIANRQITKKVQDKGRTGNHH